MALQAIKGEVRLPVYPRIDSTPVPGGTTGVLLDASGEKFACIFTIPKNGTLHKVWFRTGTVTVGDTVKVSFQDVGADGFPDELVDQYRTVVIADANDNAGFTTGILSSDGTDDGTKRSVTFGQEVAIVIEYNSYVAGNLYIAYSDALGFTGENYPYMAQKIGAGPTWAKTGNQTWPIIAIEYSDGTYEPINALPIASTTLQAFNSGTAVSDEYALAFTLPFSCRVKGMGAMMELDGDCDFVLYEGTTVRASISLDADKRSSTGLNIENRLFTAPYTLVKDTQYRIAVKPTTATSLNLLYFTVSAAAIMDSFDGGQSFFQSTRLNEGGWSDTTTNRPFIWLLLDAFDDGVGGAGGGLLVHPGMTGGLNG